MSKFSKQHYEEVADLLNQAAIEARSHQKGLDAGTVAEITVRFATMFGNDNPAFKTDTFINRVMSGERLVNES